MIRILAERSAYLALAPEFAPRLTSRLPWPEPVSRPPWLLTPAGVFPHVVDLRAVDPIRVAMLMDDLQHLPLQTRVVLVSPEGTATMALLAASALPVLVRPAVSDLPWMQTLALTPHAGPAWVGIPPPKFPDLPHPRRLSRLVSALATSGSLPEAAALCGISRGTLLRQLRLLRSTLGLLPHRTAPATWAQALIAALAGGSESPAARCNRALPRW